MGARRYEYQSEFARKHFNAGFAEGVANARAKGKAELLLKLLGLRFGEVPEAAVERVRGASAEEMDGFIERILFASSIDDVLG